MDFTQYEKLAGVTLLEDDMPYGFQGRDEKKYLAARGPLNYLRRRLKEFSHTASLVDAVKRSLFYGDKFRLALSPEDNKDPRAIVMTARDRQHADFVHGVVGVVTESGELAEILDSFLSNGDPGKSFAENLDGINLKEEIGDMLWYLSVLAKAGKFTLEECAEANIRKLRARYPEGFSEAAALDRDIEAELAQLQ